MLFWVNEFELNFPKAEGVCSFWKFWLFQWCETPTQNVEDDSDRKFCLFFPDVQFQACKSLQKNSLGRSVYP